MEETVETDALEATNVFAAFLNLAVILAAFSPLADPARLSVQDQVARLSCGRTEADKFDFNFLRFRSGRYGVGGLAVRLRIVRRLQGSK